MLLDGSTPGPSGSLHYFLRESGARSARAVRLAPRRAHTRARAFAFVFVSWQELSTDRSGSAEGGRGARQPCRCTRATATRGAACETFASVSQSGSQSSDTPLLGIRSQFTKLRPLRPQTNLERFTPLGAQGCAHCRLQRVHACVHARSFRLTITIVIIRGTPPPCPRAEHACGWTRRMPGGTRRQRRSENGGLRPRHSCGTTA